MTSANRARQLTIVGAGPAGLVAAIAAQQAGFECTVYE
ncbi:MAG: NAD(P)-binding protein, partial [Longimicrobiales bacterium]